MIWKISGSGKTQEEILETGSHRRIFLQPHSVVQHTTIVYINILVVVQVDSGELVLFNHYYLFFKINSVYHGSARIESKFHK